MCLQLSRIIYLFSSNMHDASLSLSIHTTCARLMLNLVYAQNKLTLEALANSHFLLFLYALQNSDVGLLLIRWSRYLRKV